MSDDGSHSATDVITYVGVPLAVLGVLPILYNTFVTLVAVSRIRRMLRHSRLTALTRSDVVNRVIEIELPRYAVTPWDRFRHRAEYWSLSRHPSAIPGGSWTTFNWRTNAIGSKTQRVEYADQLRQPQVEVAFDELVCYLLDLGAVPDPHGWRLLRFTGLWTPVGCALMSGPDGREKALYVAPLDDSDGHLSLSVTWRDEWTTRNFSHLPPYWVQLPPWPVVEKLRETDKDDGDAEGSKPASIVDADGKEEEATGDETVTTAVAEDSAPKSGAHSTRKSQHSFDSTRQEGAANWRRHIACQITADGLVSALPQVDSSSLQSSSSGNNSSISLGGLHIDHLRLSAVHSAGTWFASAVTAFGTTSQTVLWSYRIPDETLRFARRDTVPCGVLVLLDLAAERDTPEWSASGGEQEAARRNAAQLDLFMRRNRDQRAAVEAEARLPPNQREAATRDRMRRESEARIQDMRDRMRDEASRREARVLEALQSPRWDAKLVAEKALAWLKKGGGGGNRNEVRITTGREGGEECEGLGSATVFTVDEAADLKEVVGMLLHHMILDGRFAARLCASLDLWKAWADNGGMRKSDYLALLDDKVSFALASLVVAMIKDSTSAADGTLAMDLQECLRMWRKVRLG